MFISRVLVPVEGSALLFCSFISLVSCGNHWHGMLSCSHWLRKNSFLFPSPIPKFTPCSPLVSPTCWLSVAVVFWFWFDAETRSRQRSIQSRQLLVILLITQLLFFSNDLWNGLLIWTLDNLLTQWRILWQPIPSLSNSLLDFTVKWIQFCKLLSLWNYGIVCPAPKITLNPGMLYVWPAHLYYSFSLLSYFFSLFLSLLMPMLFKSSPSPEEEEQESCWKAVFKLSQALIAVNLCSSLITLSHTIASYLFPINK